MLKLALRSIVIPLTTAVMNVLAAGASFGVVVAIFQWGWGSDAIGEFGIGLATAILLDAVLLRTVLPAICTSNGSPDPSRLTIAGPSQIIDLPPTRTLSRAWV